MKIGIYLRGFPKVRPLNDGLSIAVGGLAEGLAANGADVAVLCDGPERQSEYDPSGFRVERFPSAHSRGRFGISRALKTYLDAQFDARDSICVLNGMFSPGVQAIGRYLRDRGLPYVMAPHDPYDPVVFESNPHLKWPYWHLIEKRLLNGAAAIQILDERHGQFIRQLGVRKVPILLTQNGVTSERVPPTEHLSWSDSPAPVRILYLGRYDIYNKGLDILIDAFAALDLPDATLTIQGPDRDLEQANLERRAAHAGLASRVRFHPPDYEARPYEIIGEYDIFCSPSRFEGFGLAALEAMLAARVLLVSEKAGIAHHVSASGCGVVVPPSVEDVRAGLAELIARRADWKEMGLAGRAHALSSLDWRTIARDLLDEYRTLVRTPRSVETASHS